MRCLSVFMCIQGAGTDANVFLTLFGEHNGQITKTKPTKLENRWVFKARGIGKGSKSRTETGVGV